MIVISGALVFVALVLLVIGLFDPALGFVYASIAVSAAALVFLLIGVFQRRGEDATAAAPAGDVPATPEPAATPTAVTAVVAPVDEAPVAASDGTPAAEAVGGTVLVVADRPRYHVAGCRYLAGKDAEEVDVVEAREEGFTPCGVCKPDAALAAQASVPAAPAALEPADEPEDDEDDASAAALRAPEPTTAVRTGRAAAKAPARAAAPAARPTKAVKPAATPAKAPAKAAKAPAKAPAKAAAKAPAKAAAKAPTVVVIPDRGKFHTAECRYVRGVAGAEELTKAQATRQGYAACGVCKP